VTYETGFAAKQDIDPGNWHIEDATGHVTDPEDAPAVVGRGVLLEVDSERGYARVRLPPPSTNYMAGPFRRSEVVDLNEYAAARIARLRKEGDDRDLAKLVDLWIAEKQIFWWERNAPFGLEVNDRVRATARDELAITVARVKDDEPVPIGLDEVVLQNMDLEQSEPEQQKREDGHATLAQRPAMSTDEVMKRLASVELIKQYLPDEAPAVIWVAATDESFNQHAAKYVEGSAVSPAQIRAFADRSTEPVTVRLRPGAKGIGTEVHEMLHVLSDEEFRNRLSTERVPSVASLPFNEGMTEYFTRKATSNDYERDRSYPFEFEFIQRLVDIGVSDSATLASLYFAGAWQRFDDQVRVFAGDWVSLKAIRTAQAEDFEAVCAYLEELRNNKTAPLGPAPPPPFVL
jgi:hypothetical protein